ncbi:hypothetical protein AB0I72_03885 [Nocardiopsis sp. NPDC049922]|uniref:hypothetical protein n=1 Tax=Nocardiopsis sp. NPDC049922 TaxID=3155157 RepID=UPI0033D17B7D
MSEDLKREELPNDELRFGAVVVLKGLGAVVAVGAWVLAALWMLVPVAYNGASPAGSILPVGYVVCAPPAWEVDERQEWPGCLERREQAPTRALTAVVIALPATWLWLGLRVPSTPARPPGDRRAA